MCRFELVILGRGGGRRALKIFFGDLGIEERLEGWVWSFVVFVLGKIAFINVLVLLDEFW